MGLNFKFIITTTSIIIIIIIDIIF